MIRAGVPGLFGQTSIRRVTARFHDPGTQKIIPLVYQAVIYSRANIQHGEADFQADKILRGCSAVLFGVAAALREYNFGAAYCAGSALLLRMRVRRRKPLPRKILRNSQV